MKASPTPAPDAGSGAAAPPLSKDDRALVDAARRIIALRRKPEWHSVGCALRTRSGRVFTSVHVGAYVGRIDVCAEAIAIGMGAAEGDTDIETIVAVNKEGHVVAPCGIRVTLAWSTSNPWKSRVRAVSVMTTTASAAAHTRSRTRR